ncbi:tyrosine-protein phosphatase [Gordonia sp. CPCC 206044]|uniref:tyrosine-protein phosphatase n=1 Tax=Gordonia sp. CPCC 206044 TaxID=3140793 RepID=UPI003AF331E6
MTTTPQLRRLALGATFNLRDVGGYPLTEGLQTKWGLLFRSDAPRVNGGPEMMRLGLQTVVDLRDDTERDLLPTGLDAVVPSVRHRPLDPRSLMSESAEPGDDPLGDLYVALIRERGEQLAEIVSDLARPGALPALVHCAAGKDRTGVVLALVLSAIGVPDDVVAGDYALTADYLTAEFFETVPAQAGAAHPAAEEFRGAESRSMTAMLRVLNAEYGGATAYLGAHGVPAADLDGLRAALTCPAPSATTH